MIFKRYAGNAEIVRKPTTSRLESVDTSKLPPSTSETPDIEDTKDCSPSSKSKGKGKAAVYANNVVLGSNESDTPLTMSLDAFTSFLLSSDNSAFSEQDGQVWQDMTRPLSDYFISSSHNTYLVGHQLVGVSTIEGYIRALLHSCRSVESESNFN